MGVGRNSEGLVASALTHLHPGMGRSPGVVDLPVVRDPLGIPFVPASELKGAIKTTLALSNNCLSKDSGTVDCSKGNSKGGSKDDSDCKRLCCLLGEDKGGEQGVSALAFADLYPLLFPVASLDKGLVFVTTPTLLGKAFYYVLDDIDEDNMIKSDIDVISEEVTKHMAVLLNDGSIAKSSNNAEGKIYLHLQQIKFKEVGAAHLMEWIIKNMKKTDNPARLLGLNRRVLVLEESLFSTIVERSLVRLTRVKLDRRTKTVAAHHLWTEEYIPHMTVFVGKVVDTGFRNNHCEDSKAGKTDNDNLINVFFNLIGNEDKKGKECFDVVVGGKETIGKGLIKVCRSSYNRRTSGVNNG